MYSIHINIKKIHLNCFFKHINKNKEKSEFLYFENKKLFMTTIFHKILFYSIPFLTINMF